MLVALTRRVLQARLTRKTPRVRFNRPVELITGECNFWAMSENLSIGGMLLKTGWEFRPGTDVQVRFRLSTNEPICCTARIVHCRPGTRVGIQFTGLSDSDRHKLESSIQISFGPTRRSHRIPERLAVRVSWTEGESVIEQDAETILLSRHGCLLVARVFPPTDSVIALSWPDGQVTALAKVVSHLEDEEGHIFAGIQFTDIEDFWGDVFTPEAN